MLRDRQSIIVAVLSAVIWLGISAVLGGFGWLTWVVAVVLVVGGVWAHVGQDDPTSTDVSDLAEPADLPKRHGRKPRGKRSIYGPPE